ncbi:hypothetical protein TIFTF001_044596 [Ficus carica]|uniref:Uncharacterized protein n=1 Tax=Ficus carica TaxID=3494 RepID=A0AA88CVP0_FICCA|nr:hypothetical protein TIFTF001_044594 [Ficus carica]GMN31602.1 hypothetical protein TIFTF001_044596 [Ficus carica]
MDTDHAAAYAFHGMLPLIFDGTRRIVLLAAWLHDMESVFRICHIKAHFQVPLASRCLAVDARLWWRTIGEPTIPGRSWEDFRTQIIARYGPLPEGDATMPDRDPKVYNDMNMRRYLDYVADWHAYPRDPEMRALQLLRNRLPPEVRAFVQAPMVGMTLENMINDIVDAELTAHILQADALVDDYGQEPVDDVGIEDPIPAVPLQEIPPQEAEIGADADNMDPEDPPIINIESDDEEHPPVINIESDDEEDVEEDIENFEDDSEEILFDDED